MKGAEEEVTYLKINESDYNEDEKSYEAFVLVKYGEDVAEMQLEYKLINKEWEIRGIEVVDQYKEEPKEEEKAKAEEKQEEKTEESQAQETSSAKDKAASANVNRDSGIPQELGSSWKDYQVMIDGEIYEFPMYMQEVIERGWEFKYEEDAEQLIKSYAYDNIYMTRGEEELCFDAINFDINALPVQECIAGGCRASYGSISIFSSLEFPGAININSSKEDIMEVYGNPTDMSEYDNFVTLKYKKDVYEFYEITFKDNMFHDFEIRNYIKPEGFTEGEISEEIPEQVLDYEIPKELDTDVDGTTISIDDAIYRVPFPVRELLANGWELEEEGAIKGDSFGYCELTKDNTTLEIQIKNYSENATRYENCLIEEIGVTDWYNAMGEIKTENAQMAGGIYLGMEEKELVDILENAGIEYTVDDESSTISSIFYSWESKEVYVHADNRKVYAFEIAEKYHK